MIKQQKLIKLRGKIIDEIYKKRWEEVWFFPTHKGVMGYRGTGSIIFLGLNPATGNFSWHDELYYNNLKKFGFKNAHLTDIFKIRKTNKDVENLSNYLNEAKRFLKEEILIIDPKLIVLLGKRVEKIYKDMFPNLKIKTIGIGHYSYRYSSKEKLRKRWRKEMEKVRQKLEK